MDRLLNHTGEQGYIYCLKVVTQLPPMLFVRLWLTVHYTTHAHKHA